ncbi:uncharacterized protein LOC131852476 [Achroia grisella]|uniref:uncharacterized protein LOC131852476 n=1 Tax=Achroia grisella TaxID=688607 RepID=UPI0027D202E7|nr:uncharacterized protein LOC131852476 [Achroia grisella]
MKHICHLDLENCKTYKYIFINILCMLNTIVSDEQTEGNITSDEHNNCPFSKIIEDIFRIHNKTSDAGIYIKNSERAKLFLSTIANVTANDNTNDTDQETLVNNIIASINRIKNNISSVNDTKLNQAIILNISDYNKNDVKTSTENSVNGVTQIKSGIEDKFDIMSLNNTSKGNNVTNMSNEVSNITTEKTNYVEILTIEPNNTNNHNTSHNIIEVLKHLMPMFNSTLTKELHNITIIERNHNRNHSFTATKNVSTIVVTYCDKENLTKANITGDETDDGLETDLKVPLDDEKDYYLEDNIEEDTSDEEDDFEKPVNVTNEVKRDILEAAEYGMQKMHELYSVLEPKLYSMGLWLDESNPARYVAAFNAPTEDAAKFSRYGYASLQAAQRLKQLTSTGEDALEGRTEEAQFPSASALRQSPLLRHCPLRAPKCPPASKRYRTHDGTCNNLNRPRWGSTMTPVQRFLAPSYSDSLQAPRRSIFGGKLPSAREISSRIHESKNVESPGITHLLMQWGQFVDHDITSSSQTRGFNGSVPRCCKNGGRGIVPKELLHPECFPIEVPPSDPFYGPRGVRCLDFVRSSPAPRDDCSLGWREQMNQVSAYIDGSPLYASSARQSDKLRLFRNGMLQYGRVQQRRPLLPPERHDELCRGGAVSTDCFKSGDARVNEQPGLVAAHIVWLRQHNRMAQELAHLNPHWSDEKIYQETRKIVGAMIQHITYREFLPIILGTEVVRLFDLELLKKGYYKEYSPKTNASPASSFSSAAFRFGHSLVQSSMVRYDRFHRPMNNNVSLHNEVTNPSNIWSMGAVDRLVLGMVNQPIQKRDEFITEELTNHLFQTPQFDFGMDLAAINIQRGRDHGVAPYTSWREPCGLSAILEFEDLFRVMPVRTVRKLESLYRHVDDIDLFTGGMSERPVVGGLVGPTFACIIAQQFSNLRKGDRFWYENGGFESSFTPAQLQQIRRISFAQVLCHTLDNIDNIQPFVFLSPDSPDNDRILCHNGVLNNFDLSAWVELNSDSNDIKKSEDEPSTQKPKRTKPTTTSTTTEKSKTTSTHPKRNEQKVSSAASVHVSHKVPPHTSSSTNKTQNVTNSKLTDKLNRTKTKDKGINNATLTVDETSTKTNLTAQKIDDKLDFKNKSRRYDDTIHLRHDMRPNKPSKKFNDYDYDEERDHDIENVQSVVINNLPHKRPYNRPIITVTENVNKYTYLINYVPRPTESWRRTTKKNYDRDVVKVTYQTYDDTYRRPNKPYYYNRRDDIADNYYYDHAKHKTNLHRTHDRENLHSSARSNEETIRTTAKSTTTDNFDTSDVKSTTENLYKLVTFGYVGNYKGNVNTKRDTNIVNSDKKETKHDVISKDFSTYVTKKPEIIYDNDKTNMRLSTFFLYETATKPYTNLHRPTRRHDENIPTQTKNKYYYIQNVLHKYPESNTTGVKTNNRKENYNHSRVGEDIEERSSANKLALLHEIESKSTSSERQRLKIKKPSSPAKTPSVAFQVIPSENSPMQWAVYEENAELPEDLPHRMPPIKTDPHALKEIPRPMNLKSLRRRPGMF